MLGYLGIAMVPLVLIIAAIAIPNLLRARMRRTSLPQRRLLRTINTAQVTYQATFEKLGDAPDLRLWVDLQPCSALRHGLPD